ncbi:type II toxin-antitoxin system VapC family toxin [Candidatus Albibeggiatoa sp. nov. NOAA]|uniref:PIN domain-containing protein n=1 Tax=Candidatus Albibeggiatoa sp. nov. NOAA TaxID=3162724 RepID=UPI0032FD1790|nr:type II toxin-antitoxin system VapC family toxin [Thiotrichaceae bacterium]
MIAIDTNVLVRILINDDTAEEQCQLARQLVNSHGDVWVCHVVLIETIWVLQKVYSFDKQKIILVLDKVIHHPHIHLEDSEIVKQTLDIFRSSNADFSDYLIFNKAQHQNLILHTFDRKLAKIDGVERVKKDT